MLHVFKISTFRNIHPDMHICPRRSCMPMYAHPCRHTEGQTRSLSLFACAATYTAYRADPALGLSLPFVYFPFPLLFVIVLTWELGWGQKETTSGKDSLQRMRMTLAYQPWKDWVVRASVWVLVGPE